MSAIATVLAGMGHRVSGSDLRESAGLARLRAQGVEVHIGHRPENLAPDLDLVTLSTAVPRSNLEVRVATDRGLTLLRRAEILAAVAATRETVAVAGTHGKTTTSSLLALVLIEAGMRPSFVIGADVNEIGSGAVWSDGAIFVVEADESDGTFLELPRRAAIVTNIEPDHIEHYGSVEAMEAAFATFIAETPGPTVVCLDDQGAARIGVPLGAMTYGTTDGADFQMVDVESGPAGSRFDLVHDGRNLATFTLPVAGLHNARNACAAAAMAVLLGADAAAIARALARFAGVSRRFEHRGALTLGRASRSSGPVEGQVVEGQVVEGQVVEGQAIEVQVERKVELVDDYAHLPTEVAAAIAAGRDLGRERVVAVYQPHRYSRTEALWRDFADCFSDADLLVVCDVYPAGETPRPGVSGKLIVDAVLDAHPHQAVAYLPRRSELAGHLMGMLRPGDLCLTLGAGDLTSLPDELLARRVADAGSDVPSDEGSANP